MPDNKNDVKVAPVDPAIAKAHNIVGALVSVFTSFRLVDNAWSTLTDMERESAITVLTEQVTAIIKG